MEALSVPLCIFRDEWGWYQWAPCYLVALNALQHTTLELAFTNTGFHTGSSIYSNAISLSHK
jgi:hypothetical protein